MSTKPTVIPDDRAGKYARILPRLKLEHTQIATGQAIVVVLDGPLEELCDVAIRLIHPSGRTYAQSEFQLGPDMHRIEIGKGATSPGGPCDVVITPPLGEFFSTTRVERRLPCFIGDSAGGYRHRCAALLERAGHGSRNADGRPLLLSLLAESVASGGDTNTLEGLAATFLEQNTGAAQLGLALQDFGRMGFFLAPNQLTATVVALAALVEHAGNDDIADLASAVIDKLIFCIALGTFSAAERSDSDEIVAALHSLLWGEGRGAARSAAALALAMATRYEPPALFDAIGKAAPVDPGFQRHRPTPPDSASGIHIQSPYSVGRFGETFLDIRMGEEGIRLDFSIPEHQRSDV